MRRTNGGSEGAKVSVECKSLSLLLKSEFLLISFDHFSEGKREFVACAVVAQQDTGFTTPCGVCRQFLSEFAVDGKDIPLYAAKPTNLPLRVLCTSVLQLLPNNFSFLNGK